MNIITVVIHIDQCSLRPIIIILFVTFDLMFIYKWLLNDDVQHLYFSNKAFLNNYVK